LSAGLQEDRQIDLQRVLANARRLEYKWVYLLIMFIIYVLFLSADLIRLLLADKPETINIFPSIKDYEKYLNSRYLRTPARKG